MWPGDRGEWGSGKDTVPVLTSWAGLEVQEANVYSRCWSPAYLQPTRSFLSSWGSYGSFFSQHHCVA